MINEVYDKFIQCSAEFIDIIEQETFFLKDHNIAAALGLLSEKQNLADRHQFVCDEFNANNTLAQLNPEQLQNLKTTIDRMHSSLVDNKHALDIAHRVRTQLIDKISNAVKDVQAPVCNYTKMARLSNNSSPVSMLALNRKI